MTSEERKIQTASKIVSSSGGKTAKLVEEECIEMMLHQAVTVSQYAPSTQRAGPQ